MTASAREAIAWSQIDLVAFDVDGTLYDQRTLRGRMLCELVRHTLETRSLAPLRILRAYRRLREAGTPADLDDLEAFLIGRTCERTHYDVDEVKAVVAEWMSLRPLRHLAGCRYDGLPDLFTALRRCGKRIGVLSDYPAAAKLKALDLAADYVVSAGDPGVMVQKPDPRGLHALMRQADAAPQATVLIGDRPDRDGLAAERAGAHSLLRSDRRDRGARTFRRYDDPVFQRLLQT